MVITTIWPIWIYMCVLPYLDNNSYLILPCCCYMLIFRGLKLLPTIIFVSVTYWVWYFFICIWFCFEPQCPPLIFLLPRLLPAAYLSFLPALTVGDFSCRGRSTFNRGHILVAFYCRAKPPIAILSHPWHLSSVERDTTWKRYNLEEIINLER